MASAAKRDDARLFLDGPIPATWNATARPFNAATIPDLLDDAARRHPDAPALLGADGSGIDHGELRTRTLRLARHLLGRGVRRGDLVGVLCQRTPDAVIAMIAVMRAGAAYVPLDPGWPTQRTVDLAARLDLCTIVTDAGTLHAAGATGRPLVVLGASPATPLPEQTSTQSDVDECGTKPPQGPTPDDIAYTIFTSGSTGIPKGVQVPHRAVANIVDFVNREFEVGSADRSLASASFCFDLSVYDLFGLLAAGGSVRVASDEEAAEPDLLADVLVDEPITTWNAAPAAMLQLVPFLQALPRRGRSDLRLILMGGDWIPLTLPGELRAEFPAVRLVSFGGATELTVWSTAFEIGDIDPDWASIPYGTPVQNTRCHVLDERLRPCPIGVPGDLHVAGAQLAIGYARDPLASATRFVPDPFSVDPGERMYRTGDRARWLPTGVLEFLGRADNQVKVHGYRIELGEVQAALGQVPGVRATAVTAPETSTGRELVAHYVADDIDPATPRQVREALTARLPEYMVPRRIVQLDELPVGPTGKVDRAALHH
ncbi:amino acid adenylation domain-containing protein [Actinoalloteichus hymeniacidonis]|uniref:Amino acid adenylation enzyme/thioester reductase family protein n=1 Tax=Actinoalloteichus hymeniacidonis TaxID=340345 RepID=A0AAC9HQZ1_9PSEU|nr:amino acid adenylation domain-containing protein [Actinoalloteichus hymeniacidonis]AOS63783.1 amino acid adenylation enzyme/thioester reductase family protein [Actinoalloteichus hymeniacidonis]MBB5908163.1 surfactin family lipopeptide synthetase A [Actinoalloteichus hymeniacidonis]